MQIQFEKSAVHKEDYPKPDKPEIAIVGRSNVGKSSFLNSLGVSSVAKVSKKPGKTRLINFFNVGKSYRLVDLPGYGFASRSKTEIESWGKMIETYLLNRENLVGVMMLVDIRRDWEEEEAILINTLDRRGIPIVIVLTKADQLNAQECSKALDYFGALGPVFAISNFKNFGHREVEDYVFKSWVKSRIK